MPVLGMGCRRKLARLGGGDRSKAQEFVVGGYTEPHGSRIGFGALLLGYYCGGRLVYGGKVGTGFDRATLGRLGKKLAALRTPISPFDGQGLPRSGVHWVKPKLVAQIAFTDARRQAASPSIPRPSGGQEAGGGRTGGLTTSWNLETIGAAKTRCRMT